MAKKSIMIRMDAELHTKLKVFAARRRQSMAEMIAQAITQFVNESGEKP
jgi:predicted HicB family RNase H-like nuclease